MTRTYPAGIRPGAGFTLIEMVVVVAIVSMFAAVVLLKIDSVLPSGRIRHCARQVGLNIQAAKSAARLEGREMAIVYDLDENRCWVVPADEDEDAAPGDADPGDAALNVFRLPGEVRFKDVQMTDGTVVRSGRLRISVTSGGFATPHCVHIEDDGGRAFSAAVRMMAGVVEYSEGRVEPEREDAATDR